MSSERGKGGRDPVRSRRFSRMSGRRDAYESDSKQPDIEGGESRSDPPRHLRGLRASELPSPGKRRKNRLLPGFGLSLGITSTYLSLMVVIPLALVFLRAASLGPAELKEAVLAPRALSAFRLSFYTAFIAAAVNAVLGLIVAWVLERYRFPGRKLLDGLIDLPFALPTAVAGIALTTLFAKEGWIGRYLEAAGIHVAYTPLGVVVALFFIGLPFVVRTVQPVLRELDPAIEEAAASLGASRWTTLRRVLWPELAPAVLTGFTLALARALGEYGSVIFIAGNVPMRSEIVPLLVVIQLEQYDYAAAAAIAAVFLLASFSLLLAINILSARTRRGFSLG